MTEPPPSPRRTRTTLRAPSRLPDGIGMAEADPGVPTTVVAVEELTDEGMPASPAPAVTVRPPPRLVREEEPWEATARISPGVTSDPPTQAFPTAPVSGEWGYETAPGESDEADVPEASHARRYAPSRSGSGPVPVRAGSVPPTGDLRWELFAVRDSLRSREEARLRRIRFALCAVLALFLLGVFLATCVFYVRQVRMREGAERMTRRRDLMCEDIFGCAHTPEIPVGESGEIFYWLCRCGQKRTTPEALEALRIENAKRRAAGADVD